MSTKSSVVEPESKLLAGAGAGADISVEYNVLHINEGKEKLGQYNFKGKIKLTGRKYT
jgi:hypothetical protein